MLLRNFRFCALAAAATAAPTGVIASFRKAVAIQDAMAYMEPPYLYYPVRQSLGAATARGLWPRASCLFGAMATGVAD